MDDYVTLFHDRYSTALLADAAFRADVPVGVAPPGLAPLERRNKLAGPVATVEADNDLVSIVGAVHAARPGDVILITNRTLEVALIGDLIVTEARRKGLAGFIVDGLVRDATELLDIGLPVVCRGLLPVGPLKLPAKLKGIGQIGVEVKVGEVPVKPGDWAFADADGVIFLAADQLPAVYEWAKRSYEREAAMTAAMQAGEALGDLLDIEAFLAKRAQDPSADFNAHLADQGRAI